MVNFRRSSSYGGAASVAPKAILFSVVASLILSGSGAAQATLRGRVLDSEFGDPLPDAQIRIRRASPVSTDSLGVFEARGLTAGDAEVTIQLLGYSPGVYNLRLPPSSTVERDFVLDFTGQRLPEAVVRARVNRLAPRYVAFEDRRARALGTFFRWDELKRGGFNSVGDALRTVRGVRIRCNQQTFECSAVMTRDPTCKPIWWIDGTEAGSFHENTSIRDIYGMEIYRGPGETPGEFSGSNAACGVIVMWTKSRPYR